MPANRPRRIAGPAVAICLVAGLPSHPLQAAGFKVGEESVSGLGNAYAGGAAIADDASTVHANPAGMTRLDRDQINGGAILIYPDVDFDNTGSVLADGSPISGNDGGQGGIPAAIPSLYGVWGYRGDLPFGLADLKLGLGVTAPFGLKTDYDTPWVGRYNEITTSLKTVNINPSAAVRIGRLSLGLGLNAQRADAKLSQAIDFGASCAALRSAADCLASFGLTPGASDGAGTIRGFDIAFGYNLGALYEFSPRTRAGLHFRSQITYTFDLDAEFEVSNEARAFLAAIGNPTGFTNTKAETEIAIPETLSASLYHEIDDRLALMVDVTWTHWSRFDELRVNFDDASTPANVITASYDNVFRVGLGASYRLRPDLVLRAGVAFDESPLDAKFRSGAVPDADRRIVAVGLGYDVSDDIRLDLGYSHFFLDTGRTRAMSPTGSVLNGEFDIDVDNFGVGLTWKF